MKAALWGHFAPQPRVVKVNAGVDPFEKIQHDLASQGVDPLLIQEFIADVRASGFTSDFSNPEACSRLVSLLVPHLHVGGPLRLRRDRAHVVVVMGATGVGKSTTVAKIAAISSLKEGHTVALISTDTYRVAAPEQLRRFGRLLSLPVGVARTLDELTSLVALHHNRDLILVDTAGQNPHDPEAMARLAHSVQMLGSPTRLLVMTATTSPAEMQEHLRRFEVVGFDGLVISKVDEGVGRGACWNGPRWSGRPLRYVTTGQQVPDDIGVPTAEELARQLLGLG